MDVEVIYPYEPLQDDELCLQVGDVITQVECLEKGWCKGVLNKVSGVFPDNFVRLITNNRKQMRPHDVSEMRTTQPTVEKRESGGRRCRVVFSYLPQHEDELTLNEGDVIDIMQEVEEGWWKGLLNGKVGMFPSNFVEVCDQGNETSANIYNSEMKNGETNGNFHHSETPVPVKKNEMADLNGSASGTLASPNSAFHPVQSARDNKDKDVYDGAAKSTLRTNGHDNSSSKSSKMQANAIEKERLDSFNDTDKITINIGDAKLKSLAKNAISIPKPVATPPQASPPQLPPKPVRELAKVLFPYSAEHDDELELVEGEIITILCKDLEDKGWWRGEMNGKSGVFPDNFVKIISSEDTLVKPPRPEKRPNSTPSRSSPPLVLNLTPISKGSNEIESTPPPPLPSKKVAPPPPPTEKKPQHQLGEDISPIRSSTCKTPLHDNLSDQGSLTLTRETPLPHVTRPKGPSNRRPPSQFLREPKSPAAHSDGNQSSDNEDPFITADTMSSDKVDVDEAIHFNGFSPGGVDAGPLSPSSAEAQNVPWLKELRENQKKKRLSELYVPGDTDSGVNSSSGSPSMTSTPFKTAPLVPASTKPSPPLSTKPQLPTATKNLINPIPHVREDPIPYAREDLKINKNDAPFVIPTPAVRPLTSAPSLFSKTQDLIKKEVNGITEGTSLEEKIDILYKDVVPKMRNLELRFEEQQIMYSRQLKLLTKDLDDERKHRACLQIEVDRLKKLITTGYAQV